MLQHGKRTLLNGEAAIPRQPLPGRPHRLRIPVNGDEASVLFETSENRLTMPAAPEGRVYIDPGGTDLKGLHHLQHHDGVMEKYINHGRQRDSDSSSAGKGPSSSSFANHCSRRSSQFVSFHNSNLLPCPISTTRLSSSANTRKGGGSKIRPAPASAASVACPINRRCRRRASGLKLGSLTSLCLLSFFFGFGLCCFLLLRSSF